MRKAFGVVVAAVALVVVPLGGADATFTDPSGDAGGGPDIRELYVGNDATNRVVFAAGFASALPLAPESEFGVLVDSDRNPATGQNGADYRLTLTGDGSAALLKWEGTQWTKTPSPSARGTVGAGFVLYGIDRIALGNPETFDFSVDSAKMTNGNLVPGDTAPTGATGRWTYSFVAKRFGLRADPIRVMPSKPSVQTKLTATMLTERTDSIEFLEQARSTCKATVGGKRLHVWVRSQGGWAECMSMRIPRGTRGKLLKLTITTSARGKSVSRSYAARVQ